VGSGVSVLIQISWHCWCCMGDAHDIKATYLHAFCLQDWELCAMCILGIRDLKVCFVCLSPQNIYRRSKVHCQSALCNLEHYVVNLSSNADKAHCRTVSLWHLPCRKFHSHKCEGSIQLVQPDCTFISQNSALQLVVCRWLMLHNKKILESLLMNEN
jgi:hypothetical protein